MNNLTKSEKWNPFREMEDLQNRLSSFFNAGLGRSLMREDKESITAMEWAPLVDISEDEKEYLITAELPEVRKDDLKITVENGVLNISGERRLEREEKGKKYHRVERAYGNFIRSFTIPDDADASKVGAEFKEGVLRVHLAKSEHAKPKSIEVKVS